MSSPLHPPPTSFDLQVTVVSAKHLKNVNWRNGPLRPYASFYLDGDLRFSTRPDESGSTRPVWNEIFTLPVASPSPRDAILTVDVFHSSKPSDIEAPKPFVGSSKFRLAQLINSVDSSSAPPRVYSLELYRPSGRPQGKLRLKLAVRGRPRQRYYEAAPENCGNYTNTTPAPFEREYRESSMYDHLVPCSSHYAYAHGYNAPPPPPPPRHIFHGSAHYGVVSVPTAPVDYSSYAPEHRPLWIPPPARVSSYNSLYCPSAPVDFSYPAEEEYQPIDTRRRLPEGNTTAPPASPVSNTENSIPPPPWVFNHTASAPVYPVPANVHRAEDQVPAHSFWSEQRASPVAAALGRLSLEGEACCGDTGYTVRKVRVHGHGY